MNTSPESVYRRDSVYPIDSDYPRLCRAVSLTCEECITGTARQLAELCHGLRGKAIGQLFVQIHPHSACAPMHAQFSLSYQEATLYRKGAGSELPAAMTAVA